MPMIDMAALPPTAQLCLKTASTHSGLRLSSTGVVGRMTDTCGPSPGFGIAAVLPLLSARLLRLASYGLDVMELTDLGIALIDHGRYFHEDRP